MPSRSDSRRSQLAPVGQTFQGDPRVVGHLVDPIATQQRTEQREPGIDRRTPIRQGAIERRSLRRVRPTLRIGRVSCQRPDPRPLDRGRWVWIWRSVGLEPIEPSLDRDCATCGPHRRGDVGESPGDPVGIAGGERVADRLLEEIVLLAPVRGSSSQFEHEIGVTMLQPVQERFSEQSVIPEPLPRRSKGVRSRSADSNARRTSADPARPSTASHSGPDIRSKTAVSSRNRTSSGDRCERNSDQKYSIMNWSSPENFGAATGVVDAFPPGKRCEVHTDGPALGRERERGDGWSCDVQTHALQEEGRFPVVHREVLGAYFEDRTIGAHASEGAPRPASSRERHLHLRGHVGGQHLDRPDAMEVVERVHVVEGEDRRSRHRVERFYQPMDRRGDHRHADRRQDVEDLRVDRSDAIECSSDRGQEDRRVVVVFIEREPGERPAILRRPLCQECGLPVSRRGNDHDQRDRPVKPGAEPPTPSSGRGPCAERTVGGVSSRRDRSGSA